jgi:hypothetical protein
MALPVIIAPSQVDAKSPVDDDLMDGIRVDLNFLDAQISSGNVAFGYNVNGPLSVIKNYFKGIDTALTFKEFTPTTARATIKKSGLSGSLKFDVRRMTTPKTPIIGIDHQFEGSTTSIAKVGSAINTQSIARSTAQITTQSITHVKSTVNIQSIVNVGGNLWRYNFGGTLLDADYAIGRSVTFASATAGGNNGTFVIVEVNASGYSSVVVSNASGVAQTTAAGTMQLKLMSFNYTNPVNSDFVVGESALFAAHTTGANNGTFEIYRTNQAGNNVWVYIPTGAVQAGAVGTLDVLRWQFNYSAAIPTTEYFVGERALMAAHTSGGNNGNFFIRAVNRAGNNLIIYNTAGVVQGGAAGNVTTNRWLYALSTNPSAQVTALDTVSFEGHTTAANNGIFTVVEVNRSGNNLVIYNESGVVQAGTAGTPRHTRKLIKFDTNQSAVYTTSSFVEMVETSSGNYFEAINRAPFRVLEVNRGGGANFNIVIQAGNSPSQLNPAGYVQTEMKSIFSVAPEIPVNLTGNRPNQVVKFSSTSFVAGAIPAETPIFLFILDVPTGDVQDFSLILS